MIEWYIYEQRHNIFPFFRNLLLSPYNISQEGSGGGTTIFTYCFELFNFIRLLHTVPLGNL